MNKKAVLHIPMSQYAFALDEERMVFRLRTRGEIWMPAGCITGIVPVGRHR